MFDDMALFVHIAQLRGLKSASATLALPAATVTRRLKKLESELGCQLIHRSARQFRLTAEGDAYYAAFAPLVADLEKARDRMSQQVASLTGPLTVLAPTNISLGFLQPLWSEFLSAYPDVVLDLKLNNDNKDVVQEQADIALRIGPQPDSGLYQVGLGAIPTLLVASPAYLAKAPPLTALTDLNQHRCITVSHLPVWPMQRVGLDQTEVIRPPRGLQVDDIRMACLWAQDGLGIALLPATEVLSSLESETLVTPLSEWVGPSRDVYLIWPSGQLMGAKAQAFKRFTQHYMHNALEPIHRWVASHGSR
ncbi:LysR family transcriptional regulator [Vibrio coralliilyticus]|uniref:LysR family transcriptional regulator n=1 Tax=Vibrio coralliilyticus TaxID=190893 RepID=UPI000BAACC07|nr:LysR family transcriptional regulator [Vibrio coralliilyticus]NOI59130.1 LysR family transcriptional regulator [Vibrio coralliilyticus]PAT66184.1 LysR family transcriptional regulator [Vibrio coralliilyticus]